MRRLGWLGSVLLLLATAGCWQYRAGYCDQSHACDVGWSCQSHRCVAATYDGGGDGAHDGARDGAHDAPVDKGPTPCSVDASTCSGDTPVCDAVTHVCRGCQANAECTAPGLPACAIAGDGGTTGVCVACTQNSDCKAGAPVCNKTAHTCGPCGSDDDCKAFDPGVCKTQGSGANGRCLRPDEVIYVSKAPGCSDTLPAAAMDGGAPDAGVQAGISTRPFCSLEPIRSVLSPSRAVVVVSGQVSGASWSYNDEAQGPLLITGHAAMISGAASPNFQMTGGNVTIRNVTFSPGGSVGIEADGGTLSLRNVKVQSCQGGGIWLNGAGFDIESSTITGNGPGDHDGAAWGGILETALSTATGAAKNISQCTVANNDGQGITCKDALTGREILAYGNSPPTQVSPGCNLLLCSDAGAMCGPQP